MRLTPQVTLKDIPHSDAVEAKIREKVTKLERFHSRIMGCRVAVESPQRRQHQGKLYTVRIDITVPGEEIVINRVENEDLYVAIRDAFDAANRKLEEQARRQRGDVKAHVEPPRGGWPRSIRTRTTVSSKPTTGGRSIFTATASSILTSTASRKGRKWFFWKNRGRRARRPSGSR